MNLLDKTFGRFGYTRSDTIEKIVSTQVETAVSEAMKAQRSFTPPVFLQRTADQYPQPNLTLADNQSKMYQRLSWIHIAVTTVAETAATTALNVMQMVGEETEDIGNHPFELLLRRPNPLQSRFELLVSTFSYRKLTGNAYWFLNRESPEQEPQEIWIIPSHLIKPIPDGNLFLRGYAYSPPGFDRPIPLPLHQVCHFKTFNSGNPFIGQSPVEALANTTVGDLAMQRYNADYFAKDNAKFPGILGFRDMVADTVFERIKSDLEKDFGGTKRGFPILRGTGGSVDWIQTAMTQKDMEFIMGREFNRDEIYSIFAPGLSSMLVTNATEANSKTGKATLYAVAVHPMLVSTQEKITNDILPVYGENLVAEFEDVRLADRELELKEQFAFAQVHTVDEVRERFYQSAALTDGRGDLMAGQAASGIPNLIGAVDNVDERETAGQKALIEVKADPLRPIFDEIEKYRRFVTRRMNGTVDAKIRPFESDIIPAALKAAIDGALESADTIDHATRVFDDVMDWSGYP